MSSDKEKLFDQLGTIMKLVVDGKRDPKKVSEHLQPIISEQVETQPTDAVRQPDPDEEHFKCILDAGRVTIPDMATVVADAKSMWSKSMGSVPVPTGLVTGLQKRVLVFQLVKSRSSQQIVDFCKKQPGAILPNVFGLRIAEMTVGSKLPRNKWLRGFDDRNKLSVVVDGDHGVPHLYLRSDGGVHRGWNRWGGAWPTEDCFVLFCD